ncbi:Ankyrin and HET domain protein, partial [Metarhizium majus ARSEF 297]
MLDYQYLPLEKSQLRVLTLLAGEFDDHLTGVLTHEQFLPANSAVPKYEAISYFWGDQRDMATIAISQGRHQRRKLIRPGLATALRHLRRQDQPRNLWCDSICINQDDLVERAAQVLLMGEVYREADRVIVWLGPEEDDSSTALEILDHIGSNVRFDPARYELSPLTGTNRENRKLGDPNSALSYKKREWLAIKKLFARPWFTRLWVRQEIVLAKPSAIVVAGYAATTWSRFGQAVACIEVKIALGNTNSPFLTRFVNDVSNIVALFRTTLFRHPVALLNFTRSCQCRDDRDRVYSLLGLIDSSYKICPDYSRNVKDVCREFMFSIYREDARLDVLAFCDTTASPSWVPNIPGQNPAHHFWRNFATGYSEARLDMMQGDMMGVRAVKCGLVSNLIGHIPRGCAEDELKERVKTMLKQQLGTDTRKWKDDATVKLTQALLGGHWFENTSHQHDPQLMGVVSVLKNWVVEDLGGANGKDAFLDMLVISVLKNWVAEDLGGTNGKDAVLDMLVIWALLNALPGWAVYRAKNSLFGICSSMCLPGDQIYAVLGCKDPIILRKRRDFTYYRIVGPTYVHDFSCGQAILGQPALSSSFVDSFDNPYLSFEREDGLGNKGDPHLQHIDFPYKVEDDHPLWHRNKGSVGRNQVDSSHLEALYKRGVRVEEILLK